MLQVRVVNQVELSKVLVELSNKGFNVTAGLPANLETPCFINTIGNSLVGWCNSVGFTSDYCGYDVDLFLSKA